MALTTFPVGGFGMYKTAALQATNTIKHSLVSETHVMCYLPSGPI